jgi:anti-sigma B factor antagonist
MDPTFGIDIVQRDDAVVVVVVGEIDIATAPALERLLIEAEATTAGSVIVDLDGVTFMDSSGLQVLVAHTLSQDNGNRLRLTRGSRQVQRLFAVSGMLDHLPFVPSDWR